jgi:hypothetical protein
MQFSSEELLLFKEPVGVLIRNDEVSKDALSQYLNSKLAISVGDATTERLMSMGIIPSIQIVDGVERRERRELPAKRYAREIRCINPAGAVSNDALKAVKEALGSEKPVRILVEGEEDLLGVAVLALAPDGSVMFYGQPLEGLVAVVINNKSRKKFGEVINRLRSELAGE